MSAEYDVGRYLLQTRGRFEVKPRSWGFHLRSRVRRPFRPGWLRKRHKPAWAFPMQRTLETLGEVAAVLKATADRLDSLEGK